MTDAELAELKEQLRAWGQELGFQQLGVTDIDLGEAEDHLREWLAQGFHGDMEWMARHGTKRSRPQELVPGTVRVISVRMDYLPPEAKTPATVLKDGRLGYVSRYAMGRDYHKVLRKRLQKLANRLQEVVGEIGHRVFVDSAPVLEKPLAEKAGLGWIGKHSNVINRRAGSWFFLGEIYTDLPLPVDEEREPDHCGTCTACLDVCPTGAIVAPYVVDARRCISYHTIELDGPIPEEFRRPMGNRIYGCDDCQLVCPWNRFARHTGEQDFRARHGLDTPDLIGLFQWSEEEFLEKMQGTAIRRIGHERWRRNIAVALGNAPASRETLAVLEDALETASPLVAEHIRWAITEQKDKLASG